MPATLVRPCNQNGKIGGTSPAGYTHGKATQQRSSKGQVQGLHLRPSLGRLGVEPAELCEIVVDREVF